MRELTGEELESAMREVERRLTANGEHYCVSEGMNCLSDDYQCIDQKIYGPCGHENCGGACTCVAECKCGCHRG